MTENSRVPEEEAGNSGVELRRSEHSAPLDPESMRDQSVSPDTGLIRSEFHEELRRRNFTILLWTSLIFNPALLVWSVFDYYLVPELWTYFLSLRVAGVVLNAATMVLLLRKNLRRYSWEGMWVLTFTLCAVVALMLPLSGESFSRYVMGLVVIVFGAGVIPVWPPRWGVSVLACSVVFAVLAFFGQGHEGVVRGDVVANSYVVLTAVGLSVVATFFKYGLVRSDFESRAKLAAVAERESQASRGLERASAELQGALARLEELDRLKNKFFANISHELRTPLTLILAPVDQLEGAVGSDEGRGQLRVIRRNAERLLALINDLLDLSRLDAGGLRLNVAEMDIRSVVSAVVEDAGPAAVRKQIDFGMRAEPMTQRIWGDAHRLEIVLTNLVGNAIKFTPQGGRIEVSVWDGDDGVNVEVENSGPGIASEDLSKVFDRFFQVAQGDRRREGGVGIGLALAKELVELHGGSITAESDAGVSTTFRVFIPFGVEHIRPDVVERRQQFEQSPGLGRRAEDQWTTSSAEEPGLLAAAQDEAPTESVETIPGQRSRILLVEDHEDIRDFISDLLQPEFDVTVALNGLDAWNRITSDPPDLVVSDVMMPEMGGTELCRAIKGTDRLKNIPVILLTARVGSEATLEAYAYGADDFVAKPFHPRVLMARIRAQLKLRALAIQLAQQEKMAVVGTLAAGILHEVRNPVNAIRNASRLLSSGEVEQSVARQLLDVISEGAQRIEGIAAALDSHARPADAGGSSPSDVREGIDATLRLLQHRLTGIQVNLEYLTERMALVSAGPMNQVFLNLVDNSLRAGARVLWIRVRDCGDRLQIRFADDGPGVPSRDAERIFDPFYTSRKDGSGTGLGLYLSRKMVVQEGGSLWYEPREGGGAVFVVEVPSESDGLRQ